MDKEAKEDNTFASKTFLSIDERFTLNATSMLDLAANQINIDLLSYQKNTRIMSSSLIKKIIWFRYFGFEVNKND